MVGFVGESGREWSYDPGARIGERSGFGEVFRGVADDGGAVAIKLVRLRWGVDDERRRREREVKIDSVLATIEAYHVVRLLDVGRVDDDLYLVMPLARRSLHAAIAAGDLDQATRIDALRQIATGLEELAKVPMLHRDLKPGNVLDFDGTWRLADFGIARNLLESTAPYTFGGLGTLPYMAPELWRGQPAMITTDLYAFGVLSYEVLSGGLPFKGPDVDSLRHQHEFEVPQPLPAHVPEAVSRLVLRLLAKQPKDRPQHARTVTESLNAAIRRLGPEQEALRSAALRRTRLDAKATAEELRRARLAERARVELRHILEDAAALANEALEEVEVDEGADHWGLRWGSHGVRLEVWPPERPVYKAGTVPFAITGGIFLNSQPTPVANLVCEESGDMLSWWIVRFGAGIRPPGSVWPWDVGSPEDNWERLTPDLIVDLLRRAIDHRR